MPKSRSTLPAGYKDGGGREDDSKEEDHDLGESSVSGLPSDSSPLSGHESLKKGENRSKEPNKRARVAKRRAENGGVIEEDGLETGEAGVAFDASEMMPGPKKRSQVAVENEYVHNRDSPTRSSMIAGTNVMTNFWRPTLPSESAVPLPSTDVNSDLWTTDGYNHGKKQLVFRTGWPKSKPIDSLPQGPYITQPPQYRTDSSSVPSSNLASSSTGPNEMMLDFSLRYKSDDLTFKSGLPKSIQRAVDAEAAAAAAAAASSSDLNATAPTNPSHTNSNDRIPSTHQLHSSGKPNIEIVNTIITQVSPNSQRSSSRNGSSTVVHFWHDTSPTSMVSHIDLTEAHIASNVDMYNESHQDMAHETDIGAESTHTFVNVPYNSVGPSVPTSLSTYDFVSFESPDARKRRKSASRGEEDGTTATNGRGRRRSPIWSNFIRVGPKFVCQLCKPSNPNLFSPSVTTRTLRRHITSAHPEVAEEYGFISSHDRGSPDVHLNPAYSIDSNVNEAELDSIHGVEGSKHHEFHTMEASDAAVDQH